MKVRTSYQEPETSNWLCLSFSSSIARSESLGLAEDEREPKGTERAEVTCVLRPSVMGRDTYSASFTSIALRSASPTPMPTSQEEADDAPLECPSSPIICGPYLTVEEFVTKYSLFLEAVTYLKNLQFTPGDSTRNVEPEDWKETNFKVML